MYEVVDRWGYRYGPIFSTREKAQEYIDSHECQAKDPRIVELEVDTT